MSLDITVATQLHHHHEFDVGSSIASRRANVSVRVPRLSCSNDRDDYNNIRFMGTWPTQEKEHGTGDWYNTPHLPFRLPKSPLAVGRMVSLGLQSFKLRNGYTRYTMSAKELSSLTTLQNGAHHWHISSRTSKSRTGRMACTRLWNVSHAHVDMGSLGLQITQLE